MDHSPEKAVLFFDADLTLYPASSGIANLMVDRIVRYCREVIGMSLEESVSLVHKYYKDYGLAVRGLLKHHEIDPAHYDAFVDGGLPLEEILSKDDLLVSLVIKAPYPKFVFTNAGIHHAERVLSVLGLSPSHPIAPKMPFKSCDDLNGEGVNCHSLPTPGFKSYFDGIIYTDYADPQLSCKPEKAAFERALSYASAKLDYEPSSCILIDDSRLNVEAAIALGWKAIFVDESTTPEEGESVTMTVSSSDPSICIPVIRTVHSFPEALRLLGLHFP